MRTAKSQAVLDLGEECKTIPSRAITMEIRREHRDAVHLCRARVQ